MVVSTVRELETSRMHLHGAVLRAAGIRDPLRWRVASMGDRYEEGGLQASVDVVAHTRSGTLQLVHFASGATPQDIPREDELRFTLDAAVVQTALQRQGHTIRSISRRWIFDDGGHIEDQEEAGYHQQLLHRAWTAMHANGLLWATTTQLALLCCRGARDYHHSLSSSFLG